MTDLLEGVTTRTTKADLMDRLRKAARKLSGYEDANVARMQEIEERVRATAKTYDLRQIIVTSEVDDWKETHEFLNEFEECLPPALARFRDGVAALLAEEAEDEKA